MDTTAIDRLLDAVVYEGYLLYPYRPAIKNNMRWTFGGLYPRAWSEAAAGRDRWRARAELVLAADASTMLEIQLRFLQVIERRVYACRDDCCEAVPELEVAGTPYFAAQECCERRVDVVISLGAVIERPLSRTFEFPAEVATLELCDTAGRVAGVLVRRQANIVGSLALSVRPATADLWNLDLSATNESAAPPQPLELAGETEEASSRAAASLAALASTSAIVHAPGGRFVSQVEPDDTERPLAAQCRHDGWWPVLVGRAPQSDTTLCAPIILYDYPEVAEQSVGDFFDATEIDEMLTLRVLTLSDEEQRQVAAYDQRGAELLARTHAMAAAERAALHGTSRSPAATREVT